MKAAYMRVSTWLVAAVMAITLFNAPDRAFCQEAKPGAKTAAAKKVKKFRGRLPNHYRTVVSKDQREAIYKIQEEYAAKIAALRAQLAAMSKERDSKVAAVLTPEQVKKVEQLAAEAKAKRGQKKKKPAEKKPEA